MRNLQRLMAGTVLVLGLLGGAIVPPGLAQRPSSGETTSAPIRFVPPVLSNTSEEPGGRSRGGGSRRGDCDRYTNLTALVPSQTVNEKQIVWGLTTAAQPTFWFYIPSAITPEATVEFVLQDSNDNAIYEKQWKGTQLPAGILSIRLPQPMATLQPNRSYQWTLAIYCNASKPSGSPFVQGLIRRVAPEPRLQQQIAAASTPLERAKAYARAGVWYDALTVLGEAIQKTPNREPKLTAAWADLLKQIGLTNLAQVPLVLPPAERSGR